MLTRQTFWFLRHGQTEWNRTGRCQGHADIPLSTLGEAEAHEAVQHLGGLGINAICCSRLKRARRTAEIVGEALRLPVTEIAGLEEMDVGPYEGVADYSWVEPWRADAMIAGVESFPDMRLRVATAANTALSHASHVLIVAHGGVFWALQHLCRAPFASLGNCHPARLSPVGDAGWRVDLLAPSES